MIEAVQGICYPEGSRRVTDQEQVMAGCAHPREVAQGAGVGGAVRSLRIQDSLIYNPCLRQSAFESWRAGTHGCESPTGCVDRAVQRT
jgi:hypothetical protein